MPESILRIRQLPHFRVQVSELAAWLKAQGEDSWWSVDGDPILTQRLAFPCPSKDLADELEHFGNGLLLLDPKESTDARGQTLSSHDLDTVAFTDEHGNRVFQLSWEGGPDVDWILFEDKETGQSSLGLEDGEE